MIKNSFGEKIDILVEGNKKAKKIILFVHGFGTDKHETEGLFDDLSAALMDNYLIVRFDFTGYGKSEGKEEDFDYKKGAGDLEAVIDWVKKEYRESIRIVAMSMGCFITSLLSSDGVKESILLSIPNSNTDHLIDYLQNRIKEKGGIINEGGISIYPRGSGKIQKIGSGFWRVLREFDPIKHISDFAEKTKLLVIHPLQDEIVGNKFVREYSEIPNVEYLEINGNHAFTNKEDRVRMIDTVINFFAHPNHPNPTGSDE